MHRIDTYIAGQQRCPTGMLGRLIGEQMVRQHEAETRWTVEQLAVQRNDRVLEIGFGAGKAIELITAQATDGSVAGIDLSQTMVRTAIQRNAQAVKAGRVTLQQGNVMDLPFADQQFNKVLSIHTFYFWPDLSRGIAEIFRVLKPGGMLVLTLSTGKVDTTAETGLERYQTILEEQLIPNMLQTGFMTAYIKQGPTARQFKTVAAIGVNPTN
jgi:ubiquinone/menaquinone biosynthesis C-methylase UbiE